MARVKRCMRDLAAIPRAALADTRLSRNDLAVLGALCIFYRHRQASGKHPVRSVLLQDSGIRHERQISLATERLLKFGWITKHGGGGRFGAASYSINWSYTPAVSVRVSNSNLDVSIRVSELLNPENFIRVSDECFPVSFVRVLRNPVRNDRGSDANPDKNITHINTEEQEKYKDSPSESGSRARVLNQAGFGLKEILSVMVKNGMPEAFVNNEADRSMMLGWRGQYTLQQIAEAAEKGAAAKARQQGVLGPRYVNEILKGQANELTEDSVDARWLARHAQA